MKIIVILVLIFSLILVAGCSTAGDKNYVGSGQITVPIDYGNGVLYFSCEEAAFANSLSYWIKEHPDMVIEAITGDGNGGNGSDSGYFVIVIKR